MENAFCFILKALFIINIFNFFDIFGPIGKWLHKRSNVDFKVYDAINWESSNCKTHIKHLIKHNWNSLAPAHFVCDFFTEYTSPSLLTVKVSFSGCLYF